MAERESNYMPAESESVNSEQSENERTVEQNPTPEQLKNNLLRKFNNFVSKYPKMSKSALAFVFALELKMGTSELLNIAHESTSIEMPAIADQGKEITALDPESAKSARELTADIGASEIEMISNIDSVKNKKEREQVRGLPRNMQINGFEKFKISNETVEAVVNQTMPKGFARNISQISYRNYNSPLPLSYGVKLMQSSGEAAHASRFKKSIQVTKGAEASGKKWIVGEMLPHEMFHLQDWWSNSLLTADERIDLLKKIVERVKSPDRYKSEYVEGIENIDQKLKLLTRATEYFAEIGAAYVSEKYEMLPQADRLIIKELIDKTDPDFDRAKALKKRGKLVAEKEPGLFTDTLEQLKISRIAGTEKMINSFQGKLREKIKSDQPDISDNDLDKLLNRWIEHERKAAIEGAERDFKDNAQENKKILKADEERESKR
jgi:hypothetical protein